MEEERKSLGERTVRELLDFARSEWRGLNDAIKRVEAKLDSDDRLIIGAYMGSIGASIMVARDKIG